MNTSSLCRLCGQHALLIKAHIFPRYFFEPGSSLVDGKSNSRKKRPMGSYDTNILCGLCDSKIGELFDDAAKEILIDRKGVIKDPRLPIYRLKNKNYYDKLARFFISVLWRASISLIEDFRTISLGPYENMAKQVIVDSNFASHKYFAVSLCLFSNYSGKISMVPTRIRIDGINFYSLILGYFKVFIKCDKRDIPDGFKKIILSPQNDLLMLEDDFRNFPEFTWFYNISRKYMDKKLKN